jgi:hypothetical protein
MNEEPEEHADDCFCVECLPWPQDIAAGVGMVCESHPDPSLILQPPPQFSERT